MEQLSPVQNMKKMMPQNPLKSMIKLINYPSGPRRALYKTPFPLCVLLMRGNDSFFACRSTASWGENMMIYLANFAPRSVMLEQARRHNIHILKGSKCSILKKLIKPTVNFAKLLQKFDPTSGNVLQTLYRQFRCI